MRVSRIGTELVVPLPAEFVAEQDIHVGDEVTVAAVRPAPFVRRPKAEIAAMLEKLRPLRGLIPADYKFDREEANERR